MPEDMIELIGEYEYGLKYRLYEIVNHLVGNNMLAGAGRPDYIHDVEGMNILPILEGRLPAQERTLFWRSAPGSNRTQQAVRQGDWKLVVDAGHLLLYNVRDDIGERHDRTAQRPDIARRLRTVLNDWARSVDADGKALK